MIDLRILIKNGVHFGHEKSRWSPKMKPYIWGFKNNIHLIDVAKTAYQLERAAKFLESVAAEGKSILWVGTKKAAQDTVERIARELKLPYVVHRWVGGTFSNYRQVRKSVANLLTLEDILAKSEQFHYSKKELNIFQKRHARLNKSVGGIRQLTWPVGAVVVVDVKKEHVCIKEALATGIPVVALVDTNSDPSLISYPIPANDDAPRSINVLLSYLGEAVQRGQQVASEKAQDHAAELSVTEPLYEGPAGFEEEEEEATNKKRGRAQPTKVARKSTSPKKVTKSDDKEVKQTRPRNKESDNDEVIVQAEQGEAQPVEKQASEQ